MANQPKREFVEAPAGHGKTEAIALEVLKNQTNKKILVLTHTNAGVNSLRKRLRKKNARSSQFEIQTIDSFCLNFSRFYPSVSGIPKRFEDISDIDYKKARDGAIRIFSKPDLRKFLRLKYCCLIVDEYQDCSKSQHDLVMQLSEEIDCLVFGDPMQGIFDFDSEGFCWDNDLCKNFQKKQSIELNTPFRWINNNNEELGEWIKLAREQLVNGKRSLNQAPLNGNVEFINHVVEPDEFDRKAATEICKNVPKSGSVLALVYDKERPSLHHSIAKNMYRTSLQSIEKVESSKLLNILNNLDAFLSSFRRPPVSLYNLLRDFAKACMTGTPPLAQSLASKLSEFPKKSIDELRESGKRLQGYNKILYGMLLDIYEDKNSHESIKIILEIMNYIEKSSEKQFRKELWHSALDAIRNYQKGEFKTLKESGFMVRQKVSFIGRYFNRVIGTTFLTKGLEFDHVIILNSSRLNDKNFYVAISRACKSLTFIDLIEK